MRQRYAFRLAGAALLCLLPLLGGGCVSKMLALSSGDEKVWWCDKCQQQVGSRKTHVCGMTRYNPDTGKDEPMEGVTSEMLEEARGDAFVNEGEAAATPPEDSEIAKRRAERLQDEEQSGNKKPWYKFWKR